MSAARKHSAAIKFLRDTAEPGAHGAVVAIDPEGSCSGCAYSAGDMTNVDRFIAKHARSNLYWSPNPTRTALDKKPRKTDIDAMRYVHLDIDDPSDATLEKLRAYEPPPTMIVFSGGGFNAYWRLEKPIHANGNAAQLEDANRRVLVDLGGDPGTQNLDRILRLPGTVNHPTKTKIARGRVAVDATLVEHHPERQYRLEDFEPVSDYEYDAYKKSRKGKEPAPAPKDSDRSRDLMAQVSSAVRDGAADADVHAKFDTHPHAIDQAEPARAVQRCIEKARADQLSAIAEINEKNALIFVGGKLVVMWPEIFDDGLPRMSTVTDVKHFWRSHQRGKTNPVELWLGSRARREYSGFVFRPGAADTGEKFNLFRGWGVEPDAQGDCSLFLAHLRDVICDGDADLFDYVLQWFANAVQTPEDKPGTCIAMRSGQGAGKGAVARYVAPIFGAHLARLAGSEQILGRFNDTLANKLMVFGDEAAWPGDKRGIERLKSYITEDRITVERKHVPALEVDNHARFIFATNRDHSAPVEIDDRRFVVLNVSDKRIGDAAYWAALESERVNGGPAALLHYLLNVPLTRDLRSTPKTAALAEQKLMGLDDVGGFARELLMSGTHRLDLGFNPESGGHKFAELQFGEIASTETLHQFYLAYCGRNAVRYVRNLDALGIGLRKFFSMVKREARTDERKRLGLDKRTRVYALPTLDEAREQFAHALKQPVEWPISKTPTTKVVERAEGSGAKNA